MTPIDSLSYQGMPIRRRGTMLNLTDMWQAADRPANRRPSDWLLLEETRRFRAHAGIHWTELDEPVAANAGHTGIWHLDTDGFIATVRGHQGGTWGTGRSRWPMPATSPPPFTAGATPPSAPPWSDRRIPWPPASS
ncbi:hypothetical protein ACFQY5_40485 [Paeniroseomonas aquatica]|uniref:hypothetical protein n=1 Tax=Paeniroseomonas aquatica TaxID=373043 RepID=UPI00360E9DF2